MTPDGGASPPRARKIDETIVIGRRHEPAGVFRRGTPIARAVGILTACALPWAISPRTAAQPTADEPPASSSSESQPKRVEVTDRGTVRLHVVGEDVTTVLHLLSLEGERNIVASPGVKGTVTANLYDVTFREALEAILMPIGADFRIAGKFIYVYTRDELQEMEQAKTEAPQPRVYRLNYLSASDVETYLRPLLAKDETLVASPASSTGLKSDAEDAGGYSRATGDFIIVTARKETHEKIRALLDKLDVRPKQVLIEATILRAELDDQHALGIDFTLLGGVDLQMLSASSNGLRDVSLGPLPDNRFERFNALAATDFTGNVPGGGLTIGIVKDKVAVFLRALEEITDTTVLANPKVLTLDRQKGQVIVGRRDGFLTTTVTETQAIQTVEFLETGTQLIFRPYISDDGFIRVELHPEDSVGFVSAQGLPSEQTTEVTTNILVRDGETVLIGGLFREVTTDGHSQVPGLGNLPWIGPLFRSIAESTTREEVIILLTLHVVKDYDAYAAASRKQLENAERIRVGARQGLLPIGRERIAQRHYHLALEKLRQGDRSAALWHLNLALHNNPRLLDAIRLKERLTGRQEWSAEGSGGRLFLHALIARERGYDLKLFGRPDPDTVELPEPDETETQPPTGEP